MIQKLIIISLKFDDEFIKDQTFLPLKMKPFIMDYYPDTLDPIQLEQYLDWGFPDGIQFYDSNLKKMNGRQNIEIKSIQEATQFFHFVSTNEQGFRSYGSCLQFYENFQDYQTQIQSSSQNSSQKQAAQDLKTIQDKLQLIYVPKIICLLSDQPYFDIMAFFLISLYKNIIKQDFQQIKGQKLKNNDLVSEYLISIMFSLQKPPQNLEICLKNKEKQIRIRENKNDFNLPTFSFRPILKRLSIDTILRICKSILLEKQIIIFSHNSEEIPLITESLFYLLQPLQWNCVYVPLLTVNQFDTLEASIPFIIGTSIKQINEMYDLRNKIILDIDQNKIIEDEKETIQMPQFIKIYLIDSFNYVMKQHRCLETSHIQKVNYQFRKQCGQIQFLKQSLYFAQFYLQLLTMFQFFQKKQNKMENVHFKSLVVYIFDLKQYICMFPEEDQLFMKSFTKTMIFNNLIDCLKNKKSHIVQPIKQFYKIFKTFQIHCKNQYFFLNKNKDLLNWIKILNQLEIDQVKFQYSNPICLDFQKIKRQYFQQYKQEQRLTICNQKIEAPIKSVLSQFWDIIKMGYVYNIDFNQQQNYQIFKSLKKQLILKINLNLTQNQLLFIKDDSFINKQYLSFKKIRKSQSFDCFQNYQAHSQEIN